MTFYQCVFSEPFPVHMMLIKRDCIAWNIIGSIQLSTIRVLMFRDIHVIASLRIFQTKNIFRLFLAVFYCQLNYFLNRDIATKYVVHIFYYLAFNIKCYTSFFK